MEFIFIGGTGRSGTTITANLLSRHSKLFKFGAEPRFITDPDGIIFLQRYMTQNWSFFSANKAIERFEILMNDISNPLKSFLPIKGINRKILPKIKIAPTRYQWMDLSRYIEKKHINKTVERYINKLTQGSYVGFWVGTPSLKIRPKIYSTKPIEKERFSEYSIEFMERLFTPIMAGKTHFIDDSPESMVFIKELIELIPNAKFLHVYRDMRDVLASTKKMLWGNSDIKKISPWLKAMLEHWIGIKNTIPKDRYYEICMEKLIQNPKKEMESICSFLKIDFEDDILKIDLTKGHIGRYKKELKSQEISFIDREFETILKHYNYC